MSSSLDVRFDESGTSWLSKVRASTADEADISVDSDLQIDRALIGMSQQRRKFNPIWYGFLFTVYADKRCEIDLNYEAACVEDESFFDT